MEQLTSAATICFCIMFALLVFGFGLIGASICSFLFLKVVIHKLSEKETTQKSKMYYSAQEAESEINTEIKNNNARVLSVTAVGECVLVVYEIPA